MQESDDSNNKDSAESEQDGEEQDVSSQTEEDTEESVSQKKKELKESDASSEPEEGSTPKTPTQEQIEPLAQDEASIESEPEITEVTAVSEEFDTTKSDLEAAPQAEAEVVLDSPPESKEVPKPVDDEFEVSLTSDIGGEQTTVEVEGSTEPEESESEESKSGSFLELDVDTRVKMEEIEAEEIRAAEEAERAAEEEEGLETGIFAIKTSIGHEKMVANWLAIRARKRKLDVYAILSPPKLRGYLLLEGIKNKEALQDMIKGVQHARSVVDGMSSLEEIEHFLTPKPLVSGIEEGDVVEIIAGPFKGEKAKVTQIDESKEEITVELFEAMVSIPVTIRGDHVRILEKENK
jgi:transcriptional antiterminator NusG